MSPTVIMWSASLIGAALFFAAGFLLAGRGPDGAAATDEVVPRDPAADAALDAARQEASRLSTERQTFKGQVTDLEDKLEVKNGRIGELERQLFDAQQALEDRNAIVGRLENQVNELQGELDAVRAQEQKSARRTDGGDFDDDKATRVRGGGPSDDIDRLMGDNVPDDDSIAALLQALQAQVSEDPTWISASLADDLGMTVVGAGEHSEALAVFSSFIKQLQQRTRSLLPLDTLRRFTLEDVGGMVVSSCTLQDHSLSLVTLTQHATPSTAALTDLLESTTGRL